jgi:hypothetical protein
MDEIEDDWWIINDCDCEDCACGQAEEREVGMDEDEEGDVRA